MSTRRDNSEGATRREPLHKGWTGVLAIALFAYILLAILLILIDSQKGSALDLFNLYSDSPASIVVAILAGAAARGAADAATRRTWWLLTAALAVYSVGNLLH